MVDRSQSAKEASQHQANPGVPCHLLTKASLAPIFFIISKIMKNKVILLTTLFSLMARRLNR